MKFATQIGLNASELKTIRKVAVYSLIIMIALVGISWLTHAFILNRKPSANRTVQPRNEPTSLDLDAHKIAARHFIETDQPDNAIAHLERIVAFQKKDLHQRMKLGTAYLEAGYYQRASEEFSHIVNESEPTHQSLVALALARQGIALFYLNQTSQSIQLLTDCLARFPSRPEAACFLGQIEASRQMPSQKAQDFLEQALRVDSTYVEGWYQLGRYFLDAGDYLKARSIFLRALDLDPLHIKSHARLGMVYYYMKNADLAKKEYLTALALNPRDFNTRYNLGELYYTLLEDKQSAFREFTTVLRENPKHVDANFKTAIMCLENGMIKEAIVYLEQATEVSPGNTRILLQLAVAYERFSMPQRALEIYKRVVQIDSFNTIAKQKIRFLSEM